MISDVAATPDPADPVETELKVWDPLIRVFHWSLVIGFAVAWVTGDWLDALHLWSGYFVAGLIAFRVAWGFIGPARARFSDFVTGPFAALGYLVRLLTGRAERHIGNSPAGGAMVVALLVVVAGVSISGILQDQLGHRTIWHGIHEVFSNGALLLVVLHVAGVVAASIAHKENLVRAMITGRKRAA